MPFYRLWEEPKGPDFVLEITSRSTRREDQVSKRELYRSLGVREYWQFDPTGDYLEPLLQGLDLVAGAYRPLPAQELADGTRQAASAVLGLELRLSQRGLRFHDPRSGRDLRSLGLAARLAQVAMMAAFRQAREELLESATRLIGELYRAMGFDAVTKHVEYVLATQPDEYRPVFVDALRRNVPGRGGDVMNYMEQLIERGRREGRQEGHQEGRQEGRKEGRQEGKLEGQIRTIEGFLERDLSWPIIEAATGIDEAAFRKFKRQLDAAEDGDT